MFWIMTYMRTMMPTLMLLAVLLMLGLTARAQTPANRRSPRWIGGSCWIIIINQTGDVDLEPRKADLTKEGKDMAAELDKAQADYKKLETQAATGHFGPGTGTP